MRTVRIVRIFGVLLIFFQLLGYLGSTPETAKETEKAPADMVSRIAYYIGFNIFLILGLLLFVIAASIKKRVKKKEMESIIDSIGKHEE